jgi:hypothetical protein
MALSIIFSAVPESKRGKQLIESNRYKPWQATKYYILTALLVVAVFDTGLVGWFDPVSFLTRSLGLSILPGLDYLANSTLHAAESSSFARSAELPTSFLVSGCLVSSCLIFARHFFLACCSC